MLERYLIPIAPYLFLTAGLSLCVYIFCSLKREIHHLRTRLKERDRRQDGAAQCLLVQMEEMRAELRDAEERTAQLVPPTPSRSGLHLNLKPRRFSECSATVKPKKRSPQGLVSPGTK